MKYLFTLLSCVLTSVILSLAISRLSTVHRGGRQRNLFGWILFELRRDDALRQRSEEIKQCHKIKDDAAAQLIAGRLTIREAMEVFASADELVDDGNNDLAGCHYPLPRTPTERYHEILGWTRSALDREPELAEQVVGRLEQEFRRER
jgi:hypothetical protein